MSDLVVAAVQMTSAENVDSNLQRARELVREAAGAGAQLIGLPENFAYLGNDNDHRLTLAEALPAPGVQPAAQPVPTGPILSAMQELARGTRAWLLLGGFPERAAGRLIRNTAILLDPTGMLAATYRKIHLFDV